MTYPIVNGVPMFSVTYAESTPESRARAKAEGRYAFNAIESFFEGFADLQAWLDQIQDQHDGTTAQVKGLNIVEVYASNLFIDTPDARRFAEKLVANEMAQKILNVLVENDGPIYWRERFEYETLPITVLDRFQKDGSYYHPLTDRMCEIMPWKASCTKAYCRLARAPKHKEIDFFALTRY